MASLVPVWTMSRERPESGTERGHLPQQGDPMCWHLSSLPRAAPSLQTYGGSCKKKPHEGAEPFPLIEEEEEETRSSGHPSGPKLKP